MSNSQQFLLGGDLPINRLGFGTMRLCATGFQGDARDPEVGKAVLRRAVELGVNHIDTATIYHSPDYSVNANMLIHDALRPYPEGLVLTTKVGPREDESGHYEQTNDPSAIRPVVEKNLKQLDLDQLDLVYLRVGLMGPPTGESIAPQWEEMIKLQQEGLIRHIGLSNIDTAHLAEAQSMAPVAAVSNNFSTERRDDQELLAACEAANIAFVPFFPLGGGRQDLSQGVLAKVAERHGATPHQIALAWSLALSPVMLPIPGTGSIAHLEENVAARDIILTDEDLADLA